MSDNSFTNHRYLRHALLNFTACWETITTAGCWNDSSIETQILRTRQADFHCLEDLCYCSDKNYSEYIEHIINFTS